MVMVFGEITTKAVVDYEAIVRKTCRDIGFTSAEVGLDADNCKVIPSHSTFLLAAVFAIGDNGLQLSACLWCPRKV